MEFPNKNREKNKEASTCRSFFFNDSLLIARDPAKIKIDKSVHFNAKAALNLKPCGAYL
jgi:hypothetical protein